MAAGFCLCLVCLCVWLLRKCGKREEIKIDSKFPSSRIGNDLKLCGLKLSVLVELFSFTVLFILCYL